MEKTVLVEKVFSPIEDKKFSSNLKNSKVWDLCFKEEEVTQAVLKSHPKMYVYTIKFNGLEPFQLTKTKCLK